MADEKLTPKELIDLRLGWEYRQKHSELARSGLRLLAEYEALAQPSTERPRLTREQQDWVREVYRGSSDSINRGNSTGWESMLNKALGMMLGEILP